MCETAESDAAGDFLWTKYKKAFFSCREVILQNKNKNFKFTSINKLLFIY